MSDEDKTEEPTAKKLSKARNKGQVPKSKELDNWFMLLAGTIVVATYAGYFMGELSEYLRTYFESVHEIPRTPGGIGPAFYDAFIKSLQLLALPFLLFFMVAVASGFIQVGPMIASEVLKPDITKLNPVTGLKRLFSTNSLMEFVKGLVKLFAISLAAYVILEPYYGTIDHFVGQAPQQIMDELMVLFLKLMVAVLIIMLILAMIDFIYQKHKHHEDMKMSKQEVKDERKQAEGDPAVKRKLAQLRVQKAQQRMMQAVPKADVVITNPTHYSIALQYDSGSMDAPLVLAKGVDEVALRIRETAKEHGIMLYENPPLARGLYDAVEINEIIPKEFYKAVAEVISYVFRNQGKM